MWQHEPNNGDVQGFSDFFATASVQTAGYDGQPAQVTWKARVEPEDIWPLAPRTLDEVGIPDAFLEDLILKVIHFSGPSMPDFVSTRIGVSYDIVEKLMEGLKVEHMLELMGGTGFGAVSFRYKLTSRGEQRAVDVLARSRYVGLAPVPLDQYVEVVRKQSLRSIPPPPDRILEALSQLVLSYETVDGLARALHSGRSTLIFGASGNGKTTVLEQYARYTDDSVIIPNALYVHGQIIRIYDAAVHQIVQAEPEQIDNYGLFKPQASTARFDQRWIKVRRPVVVVGGELTQESLELSFDPVANFYQAPPHLKAQDGMFVVDDFGRQRVRPEELLNRWILPMERGFDMLTLHTGESFTVPFEIALMFSTNLRPADLVDEAFLRRIPYKVELPSPTREEFEEITRRVAASKRLAYSEAQLQHFVDVVFATAREPKSVYPRDLVQVIMDGARFDGGEPELLPGLVDRALRVYFIK